MPFGFRNKSTETTTNNDASSATPTLTTSSPAVVAKDANSEQKKLQHDEIEKSVTVGSEDDHNGGQPIRATLDSYGHQRTKFNTDCHMQHGNSLRCIEDNYTQKEVCQPFFDAYKTCRREERERRLEENSKRSFWG